MLTHLIQPVFPFDPSFPFYSDFTSSFFFLLVLSPYFPLIPFLLSSSCGLVFDFNFDSDSDL
ncbi:hypothetical protein IC582_028107 [Cucumis melo]